MTSTGKVRFSTHKWKTPAKFNYNVAMPWTSKGLRKQLERDIRRDYPWLFQEYSAKVLAAKPYKHVLDYANVTVAVSNLLLQFTRGRGDFHVSIAPANDPDDWYAFGEALNLAIDIGANAESVGNYLMSDFERLFRANIESLKALFSHPEHIRTKRRKFTQRMSRSPLLR
jgi:hypothetical protein